MKSNVGILLLSLLSSAGYSQSNNQYLFPEFIPGKILMWAGQTHEALLNYNLLDEQMIFERNGKIFTFSPAEIDRIDTLFIGNRKFIVLQHQLVELIYHQSKCGLFAEYKGRLDDTGKNEVLVESSNSTVPSYGSNNHSQLNNLKTSKKYETKPYAQYWLQKVDELHQFISMKQLKKLYVGKKYQFKMYVKKNHITYEDQDGIIDLIRFLESI